MNTLPEIFVTEKELCGRNTLMGLWRQELEKIQQARRNSRSYDLRIFSNCLLYNAVGEKVGFMDVYPVMLSHVAKYIHPADALIIVPESFRDQLKPLDSSCFDLVDADSLSDAAALIITRNKLCFQPWSCGQDEQIFSFGEVNFEFISKKNVQKLLRYLRICSKRQR